MGLFEAEGVEAVAKAEGDRELTKLEQQARWGGVGCAAAATAAAVVWRRAMEKSFERIAW